MSFHSQLTLAWRYLRFEFFFFFLWEDLNHLFVKL